jgi:antitoxin HicB
MSASDICVLNAPKTLDEYLALPYRLEIIRSEFGDYVVSDPELPGCMTQVDDLGEVGVVAQEMLCGWLELAIADGQAIPTPVARPELSGKFVLRIAKSLHRGLAETVNQEGVSLNAYAATLLARGVAVRVKDWV